MWISHVEICCRMISGKLARPQGTASALALPSNHYACFKIIFTYLLTIYSAVLLLLWVVYEKKLVVVTSVEPTASWTNQFGQFCSSAAVKKSDCLVQVR